MYNICKRIYRHRMQIKFTITKTTSSRDGSRCHFISGLQMKNENERHQLCINKILLCHRNPAQVANADIHSLKLTKHVSMICLICEPILQIGIRNG